MSLIRHIISLHFWCHFFTGWAKLSAQPMHWRVGKCAFPFIHIAISMPLYKSLSWTLPPLNRLSSSSGGFLFHRRTAYRLWGWYDWHSLRRLRCRSTRSDRTGPTYWLLAERNLLGSLDMDLVIKDQSNPAFLHYKRSIEIGIAHKPTVLADELGLWRPVIFVSEATMTALLWRIVWWSLNG
jgi:hypothetical protein